MDAGRVIRPLQAKLDEVKADGLDVMLCSTEIIENVISLLKEQEPKPVGKEWNECPSCGKTLDRIHDMHYCGICGQAVKWDA